MATVKDASKGKMELEVVRGKGNAKAIEGKMFIDGVFECYTLEDADRKLESGGTKIQDKTAIPRGTYEVTWNHSNHFGKYMPQILNVPQYEGVRIHGGNSDVDTEGCILVGAVNAREDDDWIASSKVAVDKLYPKIKDAVAAGKRVTIKIS